MKILKWNLSHFNLPQLVFSLAVVFFLDMLVMLYLNRQGFDDLL